MEAACFGRASLVRRLGFWTWRGGTLGFCTWDGSRRLIFDDHKSLGSWELPCICRDGRVVARELHGVTCTWMAWW